MLVVSSGCLIISMVSTFNKTKFSFSPHVESGAYPKGQSTILHTAPFSEANQQKYLEKRNNKTKHREAGIEPSTLNMEKKCTSHQTTMSSYSKYVTC